MWTARQVVHGERAFDVAIAEALEGFNRHLRIGINAHLKDALGLGEGDPPTIEEPELSMGAFMLVGTTVPTEDQSEGDDRPRT